MKVMGSNHTTVPAYARTLHAIVEAHGSPAVAARAPGRVNFIGDHIDYCGGLVMPFAIEESCIAAVYPESAPSSEIVLTSLNSGVDHRFAIASALTPGVGSERGTWESYVLGVIAGLAGLGPIDEIAGCRIVVATDIPLGAGLSSSAALEVSSAIVVAARCGLSISGLQLARLCQRAEHEFAGVPCGLMDQAISVLGLRGHALLLDCATSEYRHAAIPNDCQLVVINSGVKHALADGEYGKRRAVCERAAAVLGVEHLAHAEQGAVDTLDSEIRPFARHVVTEAERVCQAESVLSSGDLVSCGRLMFESHASLRDDFRVSCPEVDAIVDSLALTSGVFGARMTGGGFGGCVIALTRQDALPAIEEAVASLRLMCPRLCVMSVRAGDGAHQLSVVPS